MSSPATRLTPRATSRQQSGMVLIVAMVMLVVIGLASVAIMRNALGTDLVSDNNRQHAQALQAAQAALRYCEAQVVTDGSTYKPAAAAASIADENWNNYDNWKEKDAAKSEAVAKQEVSSAFIEATAANTADYAKRSGLNPQCMSQYRTLTSGQVIVITARGFSQNYQPNETTDRTEAGAVVWLQSIVQVGEAS
jgi:Tfp pilus assembly protein PilX